jgi:hypothetical protein
MRADPSERLRFGTRGREIIRTVHAPRHCADAYARAIEQAYHDSARGPSALVPAVAQLDPGPADDHELARFAQAMAQYLPPRLRLPQRLVEVDPWTKEPAALDALARLLRAPSGDYRVEPVYLHKDGRYWYARRFALQALGCAAQALRDEVAEFHQGDSFVPLPHAGEGEHADVLKNLSMRGVHFLTA